MQATFNHFVEYEIEESPSVAEIIASLEANDALLRQAGLVLERCIPGLEIQQATVAIRRISQESPLSEYFAFALVMTFQEELKREVPRLLENIIGKTIPPEYDTLVTVLVMLIAIYGISAVFKKLFPGKEPKHLQEEYGRLINVAGNYVHLDPQNVDEAVRAVVDGPHRRQAETASRRFFAPVRGRKNRGIRGPGNAQISEEAVAEVPADLPLPDEEESKTETAFHQDVKVVLHAADKDRGAYGWAGHIPGVVDNRVRMQIDKGIKPERLFGRRSIRGDVLVSYDVEPDGELVPREFLLLAIRLPK